MKLHLVLPAAAAVLALTGCADLIALFQGGDQCTASTISHGGEWEIDGLHIPKSPTDAFAVGKVKYTQAQAQQLSDDAKALEDLRLAHCVDAKTVNKLVDQGKVEAKDFFSWSDKFTTDWNATRVKMKYGVVNARTPEEGLAKADEAKEEMLKGKEQSDKQKAAITGKTTSDSSPPSPPPWTSDMTALSEAVHALDTRVRKIELTSPPAMPALDRTRIGVTGFEPHGVTLSADGRDRMAASVRDALSAAPPGLRWTADLVGYADASGSRLRNIDLGLQRARVAESELRVLFPEIQIGAVGSGGIAGTRDADRKVDIFLSLISARAKG